MRGVCSALLHCSAAKAALGWAALALAVSVCWPGMAVRMVRQTACPLCVLDCCLRYPGKEFKKDEQV